MPTEILLSILTPSIPSRFEMVKNLSERIRTQIGDLPVEHVILLDNKKRSVGEKRDALTQMANGLFVIQLDDDDLPHSCFVQELVSAIKAHPDVDVIVFNQHATINGKKFTVRFGLEYENEPAYTGDDDEYGDIKRPPYHVCAWRRGLAQKYHFPPLMEGEDWVWVQQLLTEAKTQHRIERVLHTYRYNSKVSEAKEPKRMAVPEITSEATLGRLKEIGGSALSTTNTLYWSYRLARAVIEAGIAGSMVECGVYAGSQCGAMALAVQELGVLREPEQERLIHCFDSFKGFPKASVYDDSEWKSRLGVGDGNEPSKPLDPSWGFSTDFGAEGVKRNFLAWGFPVEMFCFHEGWFENTVPEFDKTKRIALLRLDGDLYGSTLVCLQHLYPLLQHGGVCIIDDYGLAGCRKACDEYFADDHTGRGKIEILDEPSGSVWWVKQ